MSKSKGTHVTPKVAFWTKSKKWLAGLSGVIGIIVVILTQVLDLYKTTRDVNQNNFSNPSQVKEMTNSEVVKYLKDELFETRMEITRLIIITSGHTKGITEDSITDIRVRPEPSRRDSQ